MARDCFELLPDLRRQRKSETREGRQGPRNLKASETLKLQIEINSKHASNCKRHCLQVSYNTHKQHCGITISEGNYTHNFVLTFLTLVWFDHRRQHMIHAFQKSLLCWPTTWARLLGIHSIGSQTTTSMQTSVRTELGSNTRHTSSYLEGKVVVSAGIGAPKKKNCLYLNLKGQIHICMYNKNNDVEHLK